MRIFVLLLFLTTGLQVHGGELIALTYHDVTSDPGDDAYAVSRAAFVAQMDYLEMYGYQPVSLSLLEKIRRGTERMPRKPILLTFDDGLKSFHDFIVPLLAIYGYPSLASVVTGWLDGKNIPPEYQAKLMDWDQVRKISNADLVEVISHTHDLHHGIRSNPQGNVAAASITRQYFPFDKSYETEAAFRQRINSDLQHSVTRFKQELGFEPRAIAWPYGEYDSVLISVAATNGMRIHLTLNDQPTTPQLLPQINRRVLVNYSGIDDFINELTFRPGNPQRRRFVELRLDSFLGASMEDQEQILSNLLDRLQDLGIDMVIVSPFNAKNTKAFFPNKQIPVAGEILNRVLHQISNRLSIRHIYLKLPIKTPARDTKSLYTELARLHRFNGMIFPVGFDQGKLRKIKKIVRYHHPRMQFGSLGKPQDTTPFDFVVISLKCTLPSQELRKKVAQIKGIPLPVYLSLARSGKKNDAKLINALRTVRSAGVQNFGYSLDNYVVGLPQLDLIAKEFTAKSSEG